MGEDTRENNLDGASDSSIDQKIQRAYSKGCADGKKEAEIEYRLALEQLEQDNRDKFNQLRQELITDKGAVLNLDSSKKRIAELEELVSTARGQITTAELAILLDYAQMHPSDAYSIFTRSVPLLIQAKNEKFGLGDLKLFFNNFSYTDRALDGNLGYALFIWATDMLQNKSLCESQDYSFKEISVLLRYFREKIEDKEGSEVESMIKRCVGEPTYCARLKPHSHKKIEQLDEIHKHYLQQMDCSAVDLLKERGANGSFAQKQKELETRLTSDSFLVGRDILLSQIAKIKEMAEYEQKHNINLFRYV